MREMIETGAHRQPLAADEKERLLHRLIDVFQFERFLEKTYLGAKVFSIEGLDVIVPMLDEAVTLAHRAGADEVVFGMAHRGRLSVLAHNLGRSVESILAEFEGSKRLSAVKAVAAIPHGGTGDVKYHYGHRGVYESFAGEKTSVRLYPNPSHLEFVDPVVTGGARFLQNKFDGPELTQDTMARGPGPAARRRRVPGPGRRRRNAQPAGRCSGYSTGGTVHIIQDNQVGFTTDPEDARSTPYAGDLAKGFNVPIIHVNSDDVEACMSAVRLAMAYRERWHRDVVIDVIGYRRFGHNETDEPAYTQPIDRREDQGPEAGLRALRRAADRRGRDHRRDRRRGGRLAQSRDVGGAEGPARADGRGRLRGPDGRHRHRRTRPHRQPAGRHGALPPTR